MDITCLSDTHGHFPKDLLGGDLLIVAGDLTARDLPIEHINFYEWCREQKYRKIIIIGGNHDNFIQKLKSKYFPPTVNYSHCEYLCDSGTEFEGLRIWGSPWSLTFPGMNPKCKAFTVDTEEKLAEKFALIPDNIDILITHSPPYGILDEVKEDVWRHGWDEDLHVGSKSLAFKVGSMETPPKLWVWGHIHEAYGKDPVVRQKPCIMVNASHVNELYQPVNKSIRVIL